MGDIESNLKFQHVREYGTWGILIGGALLIRAAFASSRMVLSGDEIHYAESLHWFMKGRILEGLSDYWSFFYPFFAVPFGLLSGNAEWGLRALSVISGALCVIPGVLLAGRLWGRRAALFTGVFIALHPTLIVYSTVVMTESLYTLLLIFTILLIIRYMQVGGWWSLAVLGVLLGLAYLTRQEAQFVLVLILLLLAIGKGSEGLKALPGARIGRAIMVAVVFTVTVLPYHFMIHEKTGHWTSGSKASVNLSSPHIWDEGLDRERYVYSLNEQGTERRIEEAGRQRAAAILWRQRSAIASQYLIKLSRGIALVPFLLSTPFLLLLVPLGLFGREWRERGAELVLLLVGILPFLLYAFFRIEIRYLVPFLPIYLLWGARGCEVITNWLKGNISTRPALGFAVLLIVFASLIPFTIHRYSRIRGSQPLEYREIGQWIKENEGEGARILAHPGCSVSYYAGNPKATFIPWTGIEGLLGYAHYHRFDYLVVDENYIRTLRPLLAGILEGADRLELEEIHTFRGHAGNRIVLYRITPHQ